MLLAVNILLAVSSLTLDDIASQCLVVIVLLIAGSEVAIGLGVIIVCYRVNNTTQMNDGLTSLIY